MLSITIVLSIMPLFFKSDLEAFPKINLIVGSLLLLIITIGFIGLRDPYGNWRYFGDTSHYTDIFFNYLDDPIYGIKSDYGFYYLMLFSKTFLNIYVFYLICALIYILPIYLICKKWFADYALFAIILFVSSMSFWSFGINGVRNGLATSFFILGIYFYDKKWLMYLFIFISITFHKSLLLTLIAFLISFRIKDTKILIRIWLFLVVFSFLFGDQVGDFMNNFMQNSGLIEDKRVDTYFSDELDGELMERKYRLDFILYSAVAVFLGYYYKYKKGFEDKMYNLILNTYIIANSIWILLIYAAYTNRIAYLSWFIMPLVLAYPILKNKNLIKKQSLFLAFLILGSLLFTLLIFIKTTP